MQRRSEAGETFSKQRGGKKGEKVSGGEGRNVTLTIPLT